MTAVTEGRHAGDFVISLANGNQSMENGTAGEDLTAGMVVKEDAGDLVEYDGSGTVVGVAWANAADGEAVAYVARDAEVNQHMLTSGEQTDGTIDTGGIAGLADLGVICRA